MVQRREYLLFSRDALPTGMSGAEKNWLEFLGYTIFTTTSTS